MKTSSILRLCPMAAILAAVCLTTSLTKIADAAPAKLDPPVKPAVTGKFLGDGKPAAIKYVFVEEHEEFDSKPAVTLIFTEKDPATSKKPSWDAGFGKLGSALILSVFYDGQIFGCEVAHSAHKKSGFSATGEIKTTDFKIEGGNVTGHVTTGGTLDAFGQKWEVDMTFAAPLPEKLRTASLALPKPAANVPPPASGDTPDRPAKAAATPTLFARDLPLPKDAKDVQFKGLVEQIHLTSAQPVTAVADDLSARLKKQGWKDGTGGVRGPKSAILKREQGDASLTIMIQQAPAGSTVKIFAEGLNWDGVPEGQAPAAGNPPADIDAAEKEAQKALKDALKSLPKGF